MSETAFMVLSIVALLGALLFYRFTRRNHGGSGGFIGQARLEKLHILEKKLAASSIGVELLALLIAILIGGAISVIFVRFVFPDLLAQ